MMPNADARRELPRRPLPGTWVNRGQEGGPEHLLLGPLALLDPTVSASRAPGSWQPHTSPRPSLLGRRPPQSRYATGFVCCSLERRVSSLSHRVIESALPL